MVLILMDGERREVDLVSTFLVDATEMGKKAWMGKKSIDALKVDWTELD